jgi:hypothetical protein
MLYSFYSEVTLFFRLSVRVIPARPVESRDCLSPLILTAQRRDAHPHHTGDTASNIPSPANNGRNNYNLLSALFIFSLEEKSREKMR